MTDDPRDVIGVLVPATFAELAEAHDAASDLVEGIAQLRELTAMMRGELAQLAGTDGAGALAWATDGALAELTRRADVAEIRLGRLRKAAHDASRGEGGAVRATDIGSVASFVVPPILRTGAHHADP